nr:PAS domain-containing protein tyrosine kinase family protein [Tanacetum cinerariifolium]
MKTEENNIDHDFVSLDLTHDVSSTNEHFTDNPAPDSMMGVKTDVKYLMFYLQKQRHGWIGRELHGHGKVMKMKVVLMVEQMSRSHGMTVTPPDGAWMEYVTGGVTLLRISSTKHKERPLR